MSRPRDYPAKFLIGSKWFLDVFTSQLHYEANFKNSLLFLPYIPKPMILYIFFLLALVESDLHVEIHRNITIRPWVIKRLNLICIPKLTDLRSFLLKALIGSATLCSIGTEFLNIHPYSSPIALDSLSFTLV